MAPMNEAVVVGLLVFLTFMDVLLCSSAENRTVNTTHGLVMGIRSMKYSTYVESYLGIPFAKPPVDHLRFKRPVPMDNWHGVKHAIRKPNSCYQTFDTMFERMPGVEMWNANTNISEDCLYLNVWTPDSDNKSIKRAVMVWIFGGGFYYGSSTLDLYDGHTLAAMKGVVVVSMNYRVGPFGFAYLGNYDIPGNMGLLDQQLALKWIHENIERFGGDREKITIFGESAGAASVAYHLIAPGSWNYFNRAILQSGSFLAWWAYLSPDSAKTRTVELAKLTCKGNNDIDAMSCLMNSSADSIVNNQWNIKSGLASFYFQVPMAPTIDGTFISENPRDLLHQGRTKNTSVLLGNVEDEGTFYLLYGLLGSLYQLNITKDITKGQFLEAVKTITPITLDNVEKLLVVFEYLMSKPINEQYTYRDVLDDLAGDLNFICPTVYLAQYYAAKNLSVYQYSFIHRNKYNPWPEWMGVLHGYEIDYVFGTPYDKDYWPIKFTSQEQMLSNKVMTFWTNFAKFGNPNMDGNDSVTAVEEWRRYNTYTQDYILLDAFNYNTSLATGVGLRYRECKFWKDHIPAVKLLVKQNQENKMCPISKSSAPSQLSSIIYIYIKLIVAVMSLTYFV